VDIHCDLFFDPDSRLAHYVIASQEANPSTTLFIISFVLQGAGLSPLFLATSGFLGIVAQKANLNIPPLLTRIIRLSLIVALALAIKAGSDTSPQDQKQDKTLKEISSLLFLLIYVVLVGQHGYYWMNRRAILRTRRTLLVAISCALPFLFIRLLYSILGAFTSSTSPFNLINGSVGVFLVMEVLMECIAVLIYVAVGLRLKLDPAKDSMPTGTDPSDWDSTHLMPPSHSEYAPPYLQNPNGQYMGNQTR